jgi:hypothetical protein
LKTAWRFRISAGANFGGFVGPFYACRIQTHNNFPFNWLAGWHRLQRFIPVGLIDTSAGPALEPAKDLGFASALGKGVCIFYECAGMGLAFNMLTKASQLKWEKQQRQSMVQG